MSLLSLNTAPAANRGRVLILLHPSDRTPLKDALGQPVTLTLLGRDSDAFIQADRANRDVTIENMMEQAKPKSAEIDRKGAELLAVCTIAWSGIPKGWIDGSQDESPAECNRANAVALYQNPGLRWIRDQVDKFVADRARFLQGSSDS